MWLGTGTLGRLGGGGRRRGVCCGKRPWPRSLSRLRAGNVACKVYVFVDSQAAIARLERYRGHEIVQEAWAAAEVLRARGTRVYIQWRPSHTVAFVGNEMADTLARKGPNDNERQKQRINNDNNNIHYLNIQVGVAKGFLYP